MKFIELGLEFTICLSMYIFDMIIDASGYSKVKEGGSRMRPRVAYYLVPKIIEEETLFLLFSLALWPSLWAFGISLGILGDDRRSNMRLFSLCVI